MRPTRAKRSSIRLAARASIVFSAAAIGSAGASIGALAQETPAAAPPAATEAAPAKQADAKPALNINILYVRQTRELPLPLSLLDIPAADNGIGGANLAVADNNTTGKFLNQTFKLDVIESGEFADIVKQTEEKIAAGFGYIVADMDHDTLLKFADALAGKPAVIANIGSPDDNLREENCRANVLHVAPTRTMLADALGQYLSWKQWRNWFLVYGSRPEDKALADAYRRAAKRFGSKIVEEREFKYDSGSRRSDGGFEQIQQQIPQFTQNAKEHDVVVVADEAQLFGDYMPYRTWSARPVAGTAGLTSTSWHPALELWGGTQFQNRFRRLNNRQMTPLDYDAWLAVRVIGEAASRKQSADFQVLNKFIHSPDFEVAAFKGVKTTFRGWNGQLRQPLIVTTDKLLVSVSPQPGFLHQFTELDTLGIDKPETKCKAYVQ
ncbi:MAG: ABC transporter substrate-binding protein [Hyphomicrobium sp.]|nr:ABC transporter substrate-binding protein [Hyphomicrobium sp.]